MSVEAKLYVVATPIGNLEDITLRAIRVLGEVDALACEDTRRTRILFEKHGIRSPQRIFSYREQNEAQAGSRIVGFLAEGRSVALCSDAGYPGISDAGYRIISRALAEGLPVEVIPGPGAVLPALLSSGLPTSSFTFKGFLARKPGPRKRALAMERDLPHSLIIYESPHRLAALLRDALETLGNRRAAVCVELTKRFEQVSRGTLSELSEQFAGAPVRGEVTVVIAGNNPKFSAATDGASEEASEEEDSGEPADASPDDEPSEEVTER